MSSMIDLPEDDEFSGIRFSQLDENGNCVEVKSTTYALMQFWKGIGNEDTIDISEDSDHAELHFDLELDLSDEEIDSDCSVWVEAFEPKSMIRLCAYPVALSNLSDSQVQHLYPLISSVNARITFGSFEIFSKGDGKGFARYKATVSTDGIKVGKIQMVDVLFSNSRGTIEAGLNELIQQLHG
jgi:hypothetical protein